MFEEVIKLSYDYYLSTKKILNLNSLELFRQSCDLYCQLHSKYYLEITSMVQDYNSLKEHSEVFLKGC